MLKFTNFPTNSTKHFGKVAYIVQDNCCYFTGLMPTISTIALAENIITTIADLEPTTLKQFRFFDIECQSGNSHFYPGEFNCNELAYTIKSLTKSLIWIPHEPSAEIVEQFREFIGKDLCLKNNYCQYLEFSDHLMAVIDRFGDAYHIDRNGQPAYRERYADVGSFHEGVAYILVKNQYYWIQIDKSGHVLEEYIDPINIF